MITKFEKYIAKSNLAKNTVTSYIWTVNYFLKNYGEIKKENLIQYKGFLVENYKPQTVNLRLQAINKYLEFTKQEKLKLKFVKVQQKSYLENVISDADYKFFKSKLKKDGYDDWYFMVWFMAATGARVSELLQIKAEHVYIGHLDMNGKGGKLRQHVWVYVICKDGFILKSVDNWMSGPRECHENILQTISCISYTLMLS